MYATVVAWIIIRMGYEKRKNKCVDLIANFGMQNSKRNIICHYLLSLTALGWALKLRTSCSLTNVRLHNSLSESQFWPSTARPRDTRILVPEKNRAVQNRALWGLYLCTKWDFFSKNSVSSRLLFKIRALWGYIFVLKGILLSIF